ncbi:MAG: hypothetical protein FWC70_12445 [Defluviitaleaceae bacterium]|nr:hypothetical protein [Defluviitaleaceae bacterium]
MFNNEAHELWRCRKCGKHTTTTGGTDPRCAYCYSREADRATTITYPF